ncbi:MULTISPECIES: hypothetical protein [Amycolatopsis]|uniref:Uncharacterized protein n=1 Tax=Amycolatopsis dendrobii TaxID=2760662 RepID=A0A7W3ZCD8_9PSEU|nr:MULTISPECIES: hypothetical protein [Amycolatopsis]MBB1155832.1 hypothetical protein [Amycolatopsis dendrobii]UKD53034.1 hypothetical protein L3Q65_34785 [Amycolatopsis sp. FU40]
MSEPKDPERLLADALRAQAVFAPHVVANPAEEQAGSEASGTGSVQPGASGTGSFSAAGGPGISGPGAGGTGSFGAAAQTGAPSQTGPTTELPPNYGLLSGAGADSLARERAALDAADTSPGTTGSIPPVGASDATVRRPAQAAQNGPLPAHWVLLLAVLLGLAAGSVIGLLTLI